MERGLKQAGFAQKKIKKHRFIDFLEALIANSNESYAKEIRDLVFPKLLRIDDLEIAVVPSGAAIGAEASAEDIAHVDDNDDSERECGLRLHAQALFDKFLSSNPNTLL